MAPIPELPPRHSSEKRDTQNSPAKALNSQGRDVSSPFFWVWTIQILRNGIQHLFFCLTWLRSYSFILFLRTKCEMSMDIQLTEVILRELRKFISFQYSLYNDNKRCLGSSSAYRLKIQSLRADKNPAFDFLRSSIFGSQFTIERSLAELRDH